ncbi:MAG: hypothetical protein LBJ21_04320 [Acidobacteriota bacterium]|jgi:hypothetical protein|nr:hypothetical protein [Acidobacteriota bacterium]
MENQSFNVENAHLAKDVPQKKEIGILIAALVFDIAPVIMFFLVRHFSLFATFASSIGLFIILSPIVGIVIGISFICEGKKRIGSVGVTLSIIAIALPFAFIAIIILRIATGSIVVGM